MVRSRVMSELRLSASVVAVAALVGAVYSKLTVDSLVHGAFAGALIGAGLTALELFYVQRPVGVWLRRLPTPVYLGTITITWGLVILATMQLVPMLLGYAFPEEARTVRLRTQSLLFAVTISFGVAFALRLRSVLGGGVLVNLLAGRYYRPVREGRVFMFLDLKGSTATSERMGDVRTQELIGRFFFDIDGPISDHGGETHRYIGDEVVIIWPLRAARSDDRCLACVTALERRMQELAPIYQQAFGVVPEFRVGLHGGAVVASEVGDQKREVVYFGDTVNTAARIAAACRDVGHDRLISASLATLLPCPPGVYLNPGPPISLRGKRDPVALFAIETADRPREAAAEG